MNNWKLQKGIILTEIQDVFLLVADKEARKVCPYIRQINEMGASIWKQLENQKTLDEIIESILGEYEIPESYDITADVSAFITSLRENHYINEACENEI